MSFRILMVSFGNLKFSCFQIVNGLFPFLVLPIHFPMSLDADFS